MSIKLNLLYRIVRDERDKILRIVYVVCFQYCQYCLINNAYTDCLSCFLVMSTTLFAVKLSMSLKYKLGHVDDHNWFNGFIQCLNFPTICLPLIIILKYLIMVPVETLRYYQVITSSAAMISRWKP